MQILTEAEAEAEEFWQKKMLKKGHCLGKAHCIYSDNTVYYTVYIYTLQHYVRYEGASSPRVRSGPPLHKSTNGLADGKISLRAKINF